MFSLKRKKNNLVIVVKQASPSTEEAALPPKRGEVIVVHLRRLEHVIIVFFSCGSTAVSCIHATIDNNATNKFKAKQRQQADFNRQWGWRWWWRWMKFIPCSFEGFDPFLPLLFFLDANASQAGHGRNTKKMSMPMQGWHSTWEEKGFLPVMLATYKHDLPPFWWRCRLWFGLPVPQQTTTGLCSESGK